MSGWNNGKTFGEGCTDLCIGCKAAEWSEGVFRKCGKGWHPKEGPDRDNKTIYCPDRKG